MLKFPAMKNGKEPPLPRMSLREYARYSVFCLENNARLRGRNPLEFRREEKRIKKPFSF